MGSVRAKVLMVGLAPGLHGANRTGRPFTGDASGTFLFAALARVGLASDPDPLVARLVGARLTNAVKCLPPQNRPNAAETEACSRYLREEIDELWSPRARAARFCACARSYYLSAVHIVNLKCNQCCDAQTVMFNSILMICYHWGVRHFALST